jgi:hypothetical protein
VSKEFGPEQSGAVSEKWTGTKGWSQEASGSVSIC